jgi:hypothetical protein
MHLPLYDGFEREMNMNWSISIDILLAVSTLVLTLIFIGYQVQQFAWIRHHGKRISAMVTSIRHETGKTQAGFERDNYYVSATWTHPRTGKTYTFWTWAMNHRPDCWQGSLISVLIDPVNPRRYILDL